MGRGQELLDAAREGDRRTVEKIIAQYSKRSGPFTTFSLRKGGINIIDDNGYTPLHHACLNGHKSIVRLLLSVDASPCIADKKGATPLHLAAFNGYLDIVKMLLEHTNPAVNIDHLTSDRESALLMAANFGYVDVVALLIKHGADVTIRNIKEESALDLAAQYGRLETVRHLLEVRPQLVDEYRPPRCRGHIFSSTPLHRASRNGSEDVVSALIAAGIDPNIRTHTGTPLHEAASCGKASAVRILLQEGADLHARDRQGKTVHALLNEYSGDANKRVRKVIQEFENRKRSAAFDSEDEYPQFPVSYDISPTVMNAPETQKVTNTCDSPISTPSSSSVNKNQPQSFVKKLASKCLSFKAKFNSAPNIPERLVSSIDAKLKNAEQKSNNNTLLIGNSKFFKILSKKDDSGDIACNYEFDTISLDRLGSLNRDSIANRSNRSCPGFKTSLPNISENNEISESHESVADSNNDNSFTEAVNHSYVFSIFDSKKTNDTVSQYSSESANLVNDCYESYEFSKYDSDRSVKNVSISKPTPMPRPNVLSVNKIKHSNSHTIYENVSINQKVPPTPAVRTHVLPNIFKNETENKVVYENVCLDFKKQDTESPERNELSYQNVDTSTLCSLSRSSTLSTSDSMEDESNLEDILLSKKSKSFRHSKIIKYCDGTNKSDICRTQSNASDSSNMTEASAIENVDCSVDISESPLYLSMTGTLPNKKTESITKNVLFRHKTFTNIEIDRNSLKLKELPPWNDEFLKETLAHYHIRGTGHCIYKAPTVMEFIQIFNRNTLTDEVETDHKKRDSYFETAICFCKSKPPKHHSSAEDLLEVSLLDEEGFVSINTDDIKNSSEMILTTFQCFCDSGTCVYHTKRRTAAKDFVVKFSAIKKSISTPDITLESSSFSTLTNTRLPKHKSVPYNLEEPYAVTNIESIIARNKLSREKQVVPNSPVYCTMSSLSSTLSSTSSARPYSIKDIAEVISLNSQVISTTSSLSSASNVRLPLRKSSSSEYSGHWSLQSCDSNVTIKSDASFKTCIAESSDEGSDGTLHSDSESSEAETVKSDVSTVKRPWVHSDSFRFGGKPSAIDVIVEESSFTDCNLNLESRFESGISVEGSESSSSGCEDDSGIPRVDEVSLNASLERGSRMVGDVRSGSGRRRWDEAEATSEGDALSLSSAASSCAPLHLAHHQDYSKVSPTPPKKPPRRNLSVSPTHANSPSSGYSYELRLHARSQDDLDDLQSAKHYLKHGRSVDQYVDGKHSYSEYEESHNSPRLIPVPNPRPSLKQRPQPVAITAMYENIVIKEQNPKRKLRRNSLVPSQDYEAKMNDNRRKYSNQERSSLESLLDDQSINSPSDCERYYEGRRAGVPSSPTHYDQPPTPDHPPPSARQAENSIHERIRPLSQLIMEVVEEIRIRKKSQGDISKS